MVENTDKECCSTVQEKVDEIQQYKLLQSNNYTRTQEKKKKKIKH